MKTLKRNAVKLLPLFIMTIALAITCISVKSAAEWPPESCRDDALRRVSVLGNSIQASVSASQQELFSPGSKCKRQSLVY